MTTSTITSPMTLSTRRIDVVGPDTCTTRLLLHTLTSVTRGVELVPVHVAVQDVERGLVQIVVLAPTAELAPTLLLPVFTDRPDARLLILDDAPVDGSEALPGNTVRFGSLDQLMRTVAALAPTPGPHRLGRAQLDVLQLLADGLSKEEVARALGVSQKTISNQLTRVHAELGTRSLTQAVMAAVRSGLVIVRR